MKTLSQLSCILFAFAVPLAGCGDKSKASTPVDDRIVATGSAGFGETPKPIVEQAAVAAKPVAASELPAVEHWIPTKASECISLGKEMLAKGEHARARELLLAAAKLDKKSATPHVELARSYIATAERALAIRHAGKAVKLAPESSQAHNTLGRAELLRHGYDAATIAFRQATELDANNVWAWNNLGLVYMTQKNYQEAVNALSEATARKGAESYMWNNLGLAHEQLDQLDEAREAFDNGAKLGSVAAKASRKRLEGVDTVAIVKSDDGKAVKTYEDREEMPEVPPDVEGGDDEVVDEVTYDDEVGAPVAPETPAVIEEPVVDEPVAEEPAVEAPKPEAPKPEAPAVTPTT